MDIYVVDQTQSLNVNISNMGTYSICLSMIGLSTVLQMYCFSAEKQYLTEEEDYFLKLLLSCDCDLSSFILGLIPLDGHKSFVEIHLNTKRMIVFEKELNSCFINPR